MKSSIRRTFFCLLALFSYKSAFAQNNARIPSDTASADSIGGKHRYFLFSLDFGNNFSYKDKTDQITYPYMYPNITYRARSGYFASIGAFRVSNVKTTYNISPWIELDLGTGWKFSLGENADLGFSYSYSGYNRSFPLLSSALSNDLNAFYSYDFDWLYSKISFDYSFGKLGGDSVAVTRRIGKKRKRTIEKATFFSSSDYFLVLDLSHEFTWDDVFKDGDGISVEPGVYIEAGTNNFYNDYYKHTKAVNNALKKGKGQKVSETDTISDPYDANAASFKIREYIFTLPIDYTINRFIISAEYNYIIPVNQPSDPNFAVSPYSLFKFGIAYKLKLKK